MFHALLNRVKAYERFTVEQFREGEAAAHRHQIDFTETHEPEGFASAFPEEDREQLTYGENWQFAIDEHSPWRLYGFLLDDTFYVVWLDDAHCLYS